MRAINIEISYDGIFRRTPYVRQGENGTTTLYLVLPTDYQGYKYVIVFQPVTGDPISTVELTPDGNHIISYVLTSVLTAAVGNVGVQLDCYDVDDNLIKSAESEFEVKPSLGGAGDVLPTDYVPWYVLTADKATEATEAADYIAGVLPDLTLQIEEATELQNTLTSTTIPNATSINTTLTDTTIPNATSINTTLTDTTIPNAQIINTTLTETTTPSATLINSTLADTTIPNANSINSTLTDATIPNATSINSTLTVTTIPAATSINTTLTTVTTPAATSINNTLVNTTTPAATSINSTLVNTTTPAATSINNTLTNTTIPLAQATETSLNLAIAAGSVDTLQEKVGTIQGEIEGIEDTILQMNPNGDAKITVTSFDTVNSLPKNAAQAGLGVVQEGMTAQQIVINGDFSAGMTGWSVYGGFTPTVANKEISFTVLSQYGAIYNNLAGLRVGDKIYCSVIFKANSALVKATVRQRLAPYNQIVTLAHSASGEYIKKSAIATLTDLTSAYSLEVRDERASDWAEIKVKEAKVVNLTAIAKHAATLSQADAMLLDYFSGTQSAVTGRVRSVGKNLFDKSRVIAGYYVNVNTGALAGSATYYASDYIAIKPNATYFQNGRSESGTAENAFYDSNKNYISGAAIGISLTFTTPMNAKYVRVSISISRNLDTFQLELGTVATTYESYRKTESYTKPMPLRRLPNTTLDDVTNGKHTKRVSEWANVTGTSFASIDNATYTNVSVVKTTAFSFATAGTTAIDNSIIYRDKNGVVLAEVAQADIDNLASIGKFYYHTDKTVWRILAKGSDDIATARTALGTETMIYQLATPVITENVSSGTLLAYPSGTVYWEPVIADVAIYATGASILNTGYPISTLESIYKIDLVTGEQTPLDVASATIASGGLSFTHTGLSDGDLVGFTYYFAHALPYGENDYTYYDSRETAIDTVTAKVYRYRPVVTNGVVVSWALTEVV